MKKGIILIAIGIMLLVIDLKIPMGNAYPPMETAEELGTEIQRVIVNNLIGTHPMVDLISDVLGYVLLFAGSLLLMKYNSKFIFGMLLLPYAIFLYISLMQLPYHLVLRDLYLKVAGYHFLLVIVEIVIVLSIMKTLASLFQSTQTKWHTNELFIGLILAMICKGTLSGIQFFFGKGPFFYIYTLVMIGATAFYLNRLYVISKFNQEEKHDEK